METKKCIYCKIEKPIDCFYIDKNMADNIKSFCKICNRGNNKNGEIIRLSDRLYRRKKRKLKKENIEAISKYSRTYKRKNPIRYKANMMVVSRVFRGTMIKSKICSICNKKSKMIDGHHENYDKPLEVMWLCRQCHSNLHLMKRLKEKDALIIK